MSSERETRILIVDDQRDIARVLKTALELVNRGYFIVDVPSGEEAMLEIQRKEFDLIVADFRLPGITGPELIRRARKRHPAIKGIVISGASMKEVTKEIGDLEVSAVLEKPIDSFAFTDAVEMAMTGGSAQAEAPVPKADHLGPIPPIDERQITAIMAPLLRDMGAHAIVLSDRTGKMLLREGNLDQSLRFTELAVLLAYNFTTTAEISGYLGSASSSAVHYYDGEWYDIYALSVGIHFFLTLVFPSGSQKQMGAVLRFGKPAAQAMIDSIGPAALMRAADLADLEELPAEAAEVSSAGETFEQSIEEFAPPPVEPPRRKKTAQLPTIHIDLDSLDAELGLPASEGEVIEDFWETAAAETQVMADDSISREDAIALGLIPKDGDD